MFALIITFNQSQADWNNTGQGHREKFFTKKIFAKFFVADNFFSRKENKGQNNTLTVGKIMKFLPGKKVKRIK